MLMSVPIDLRWYQKQNKVALFTIEMGLLLHAPEFNLLYHIKND